MLAICGHGFQYPHPLFMVTFFTVSSPKCQITADGQLILQTPQPDSDKGSDKDSVKDSGCDRYKDSDKDSGCDRDKDSDKDSDYDKVKDSDKDSDYDKDKGSDKQRKRQHIKLQQTDT